MLEIKHLEGQAQKLLNKLGNEAYHAFSELNLHEINREMPIFEEILKSITIARSEIEAKEAELKNRQEK
jgi:mevalonate kinase